MTREEFLRHYEEENLSLKGHRLCLNQGIRATVLDEWHSNIPAFGVTQKTNGGKWYVFSSGFDEREGFYSYILEEFEPNEEGLAYDYLYDYIKPKDEDTRTAEERSEDWFYKMFPNAKPSN